MSAAVLETAPFTERLGNYLAGCYSGLRGVVTFRTGGMMPSEAIVPAETLAREVPTPLLRELGYANCDPILVSLATTENGAPAQVAAVFVEQALATVRPDQLAGFAFPPSAVLDVEESLVAVWFLSSPVDLRHERARVDAVQRALAEHLGGRLDEVAHRLPQRSLSIPPETTVIREAAWSITRAIPLPGSAVQVRGRRVLFNTLALANRYSLSDLEAQLTTTTVPPRRKPTKGDSA